jgi:hypothetical protein
MISNKNRIAHFQRLRKALQVMAESYKTIRLETLNIPDKQIDIVFSLQDYLYLINRTTSINMVFCKMNNMELKEVYMRDVPNSFLQTFNRPIQAEGTRTYFSFDINESLYFSNIGFIPLLNFDDYNITYEQTSRIALGLIAYIIVSYKLKNYEQWIQVVHQIMFEDKTYDRLQRIERFKLYGQMLELPQQLIEILNSIVGDVDEEHTRFLNYYKVKYQGLLFLKRRMRELKNEQTPNIENMNHKYDRIENSNSNHDEDSDIE